ncbi:sigma-54-dependent Fis family transcriptional regulator [candidate division WOR-3 bacterium]|nr:sigma-54-dependent Fis family transcriptional regulator [candidate division WOR-3 bacterium]
MPEESIRLLLVEDNPGDADLVREMLDAASAPRFDLSHASRLSDGLTLLAGGGHDVVLLDLGLPDSAGLETFYRLHSSAPWIPVVVLTGSTDWETGVQAVAAGAQDFLVKGTVDGNTLARRIRYALERKRAERTTADVRERGREMAELVISATRERTLPGLVYDGMISCHPQMLANLGVVRKVADTNVPVLIRGESGTGKELVARALHSSGRRSEKPFVVVNCAAVPETLLEAELFGIHKGIATGVAERKGKFEAADGGTLFLDEIGDMSPALQAKLLRVLQDSLVERVGGHSSVKVDVRVVAATNQDLHKRIVDGVFRKDLYYRLSAVELVLPPLHGRTDDIRDLTSYFIQKFNGEFGRALVGADPEVVRHLAAHDWPGNIRQLEHVIKRAVVVAEGSTIRLQDLPEEFKSGTPASGPEPVGQLRHVRSSIEAEVGADVEKRLLIDYMERANWNATRAAKLAGYSRMHVYRLLRKHGIVRPDKT